MDFIIEADFDRDLDEDALLRKFGLEPGGRVQQAIDLSCINWCKIYTPWKTGRTAMSPYYESEIGSGEIRYPGPYARFIYYGEGISNYSREVNALAGSFWFERMKADHAEDILNDAREASKGGANG